MLWRITNRWQAAIRAALAPFELTHVQFVLLAALTRAGDTDGTTQVELAQQVRTDPMMVSQVLRALERKGHVERLPHPDDRRAVLVRVSAGGADLARRANAAVEAADEEFFGPGTDRERTFLDHLADLDERNRIARPS
ncbi:MarR family transcriptional regulator [Jiangella ureilytica]|uniref:MarR family transcriptional regulator n=1 Tax=Jiangella ureilytica TaxID=2530374 RepID=A0A4R4RNB2_9ACTN|nr:MarR family transcriptional regulator [Jiangella ureilytica]TDC50192.1 MarR family transcriptional regulator [Jiangella ureilytica]